MYCNNFVMCVKHNGNVLREQGQNVYLPFGSEYSILLKNLNNRDAVATVKIDSRTIIEHIIVRANRTVELERFVEGWSMNNGPKLKFIEKTDEISNYRGDKLEDGLVSATFKFEEEKTTNWTIYNNNWYRGTPDNIYPPSKPYIDGSTVNNNTFNYGIDYSNKSDRSVLRCCSNISNNDKGITVEGNDSNQTFIHGDIGQLESQFHVIILQLKGYDNNNEHLQKPIEVKQKLQCKYCGNKWKSTMKFCGSCGARLT